jgi:hypothetical protein
VNDRTASAQLGDMLTFLPRPDPDKLV